MSLNEYNEWQKEILFDKFNEYNIPHFVVNNSYIILDIPEDIKLLEH